MRCPFFSPCVIKRVGEGKILILSCKVWPFVTPLKAIVRLSIVGPHYYPSLYRHFYYLNQLPPVFSCHGKLLYMNAHILFSLYSCMALIMSQGWARTYRAKLGHGQVLRDKIGSAIRPNSSRFLLHTRMSLGSHLGSQMRKNCILQSLLGSQASYEERQNCDPNMIPRVIPMNPSMQQLDTSLCHTFTDTLILRGKRGWATKKICLSPPPGLP